MNPKIATIVPVAHLSETLSDSYFMALSYAVECQEYRDFFRAQAARGRYVILDNSSVELGEPESFETYLEKAWAVQASCVMFPDIFQDAEATLAAAEASIPKLKRRDIYDIMIIPQGKSLSEWSHNMKALRNIAAPVANWSKTLLIVGISARYTEMFGGDRWAVASAVPGPVHLLGCYANPRVEVAPNIAYSRFRGVDSSYPSVYSKIGLELTAESMSKPRPMVKLDLINDSYDPGLLSKNITVWRETCQNRYRDLAPRA